MALPVPSQVIDEIGLALPLFFQVDDVDFAYRAAAAGYPTETIPGSAVWHADFYWKDVENASQYFSLRNALMGAAIHGDDVTGKNMAEAALRVTLTALVAMRYGLAWTRMEAVRDFLSGPGVLARASQGDFARISAERKKFPETQLLPLHECPLGCTRCARPHMRSPARIKPWLSGWPTPSWARSDRDRAAVAYEDSFWWHLSTFDDVWVTDASQSGVRHLTRDARQGEVDAQRAGGAN